MTPRPSKPRKPYTAIERHYMLSGFRGDEPTERWEATVRSSEAAFKVAVRGMEKALCFERPEADPNDNYELLRKVLRETLNHLSSMRGKK